MGYPGKVIFPIISNHFAKCDHKGELPAVLSAIYYLNRGGGQLILNWFREIYPFDVIP